MPDPKSEALLRQLEWTVLRRLDGLLQGDWRTLLRGAGIDLAELREYRHGDDVRHIDWNVTARLQEPHVRRFQEDRDLTAWFLLDVSGSVDFGSNDVTKLAVAAGFVAVLARVITRRGNRVGALMYGHEVDTLLPPRASRVHVLELLERMRRPRPAPPAGHGTALYDLLQTADGVIRRRSLVFVVSDFISAPGWERPLARLARRHDLVAVRLFDPLELALPDFGLVTLSDAETGEHLQVDASDAGFRARYEALAHAAAETLAATLARAGVDTLELATDDDLLDAVLRFADLRRRGARLGRAGPRGRRTQHLQPAGAAA